MNSSTIQKIFGRALALAAIAFIAIPASAAPPSWFNNADFEGSARVRYEWGSNSDWPANNGNSPDRNRLRYQALIGLVVHPDSYIDVGFRVGSANTVSSTNPQASVTSQNNTFDDGFRDDPLYIDRMYVTYRPPWHFIDWMGLSITGGKVANPYQATWIPWASGLSPEGVHGTITPPALSEYKISYTGGYYVLEEIQNALTAPLSGFNPGDDATLIAHQLRAGIDDIGPFDVRGWGSWYRYIRPSLTAFNTAALGSNAAGIGNNNWRGGRLVSEFDIWTVGTEVKFDLFNRPVTVAGEYIQNEGAQPNPLNGRVEDGAWVVQASYGRVARRGDWSISGGYASVESDALFSPMMDPDFGQDLGNTNFEGGKANFSYGLTDRSTLGVTYYNTHEENGLRRDPSNQELIQADLSVKF